MSSTMWQFRNHVKSDGSPKKAYNSQAEALDIADRMNGSGPKKVRAYECDLCQKWHVGAKKGGKRHAGSL